MKSSQETIITNWVDNTQTYTGFAPVRTGAMEAESQPHSHYDPFRVDANNNAINEHQRREWEFRIAIYPTRENLNKAVSVLAKVFSQEKYAGIDFKCMVVNNPDKEDDITFMHECWDGTTSPGSDREQRGKEICVYMAYQPAANKYQHPGLLWKELMLECWRELINAKVEKIGYAACPGGDRPVAAEIDISTPFTYTAFKPYKGPHGILFETNYNPYHHPDPLAGVIITKADLVRSGISLIQSDVTLNQRFNYLRKHCAQIKDSLIEKLIRLQESCVNDVGLTMNINTLLSMEKVVEHPGLIKRLLQRIPRDRNSRLTEFNCVGEIAYHAGKQCDAGTKLGLNNLLIFIQKEHKQLEKLLEEIETDFHACPYIMNLLTNELHIDHQSLKAMIISKPAVMQIMFRQLVNLGREEQAFRVEEYKYSCPALTFFIALIQDTEYWTSKNKDKTELPKGIAKLQALIIAFPLESEANNPLQMSQFLMKCKAITASHGGLLGSILTFGKRDDVTAHLFRVINAIHDFHELPANENFSNLHQDWVRFNEGRRLASDFTPL